MYETPAELDELQALIDRSTSRMGAHMRSILTEERRLTAAQAVAHLDGIFHVAFATTNAAGEARVSPLDALFIHGRFHVSTAGNAARVRHMRRTQAVSVAYFRGDEIAVIVHGMPVIMDANDPSISELERIYVELYGSSPFTRGDGVVLIRIEPDAMFTYAPDPSAFPA